MLDNGIVLAFMTYNETDTVKQIFGGIIWQCL